MEQTKLGLVVEDIHELRIDLKEKLLAELQGSGFLRIDDAENGVAALELLGKHQYHFVLTDSEMPRMGGHELIQKIRGDDKLKHILIILMSGNMLTREEALSTGADDFLHKFYVKDRVANIVKERTK